MPLSIIVAAAEGGVIGKDGKMPWRLPAELARFKDVTMGHPIIMGRKTHESIGRALPGRRNIIVTHQKNYQTAGSDVVHSIDAALKLVKGADEIFIIGGASIYEQTVPLADRLYLTDVHTQIDGDAFFKYDPNEWRLEWSENHPADAENKYAFTLKRFVRK